MWKGVHGLLWGRILAVPSCWLILPADFGLQIDTLASSVGRRRVQGSHVLISV
jgi:hypothetical protein